MDKIPEDLKHIRFAALDMLRDYNYFLPPINVVNICKGEWIDVNEFDFPLSIDELAWYFDFKSRIIYLNKSDDNSNKIFVISYILGNYLLNKESMEKFPEKYSIAMKKMWSLEWDDLIARQAICFARNLLVPKFILDAYRDLLDINDLSKIFGVTPLLIQKRIEQEYE